MGSPGVEASGRIRVLLADDDRPLLDGVTAVARLRHDHPSVCLIALTGDAAPRLHDAAREAGADAVVLKDDFFAALVERLHEARTGRAES